MFALDARIQRSGLLSRTSKSSVGLSDLTASAQRQRSRENTLMATLNLCICVCSVDADKIGSGSYGIVYKTVRKVDRMVYAMKEIDLAGMSRKVSSLLCIRAIHARYFLAFVCPPDGGGKKSPLMTAGARGVHPRDPSALEP